MEYSINLNYVKWFYCLAIVFYYMDAFKYVHTLYS